MFKDSEDAEKYINSPNRTLRNKARVLMFKKLNKLERENRKAKANLPNGGLQTSQDRKIKNNLKYLEEHGLINANN